MKIRKDTKDGNVVGYVLWLSENDVSKWANRPGKYWPYANLVGHRLRVDVDSNGICDFQVAGTSVTTSHRDHGGDELEAIVADHLPSDCRHLWPVWATATIECLQPA